MVVLDTRAFLVLIHAYQVRRGYSAKRPVRIVNNPMTQFPNPIIVNTLLQS